MVVKPIKRGASKKKVAELTERQRLFVHEFLADETFNANKAARKAGYKNASLSAARCLANPIVSSYLGQKLKERMDSCDVSAERVLRELCCIGFANPKRLFDEDGVMLAIADMDDNTARSISSIKAKVTVDREGCETTTTEVRFWSKPSALELIAKHLGMLDDRIKMDHGLDDALLSTLLGKVESERRSNIIDANYVAEKVNE